MMGSAPEAHDAVSVFREETHLVRRLPMTPRAEGNELFGHRYDTRRRLRRPFGHGPDDAPSGAASRTRLVTRHDEPHPVIQAERCDGDLPGWQCEGRGDALRANCTGLVPEEHSDLLAERPWHSPNSHPNDSSAFTEPSRPRRDGTPERIEKATAYWVSTP
jgi:hypothetical protein